MKPYKIPENQHFIGREREITRLQQIAQTQTPAILIVYGRRRIGKTELLEQTFRNRHVIKFEGREGLSETDQMKAVLRDLADYANEPLLRDIEPRYWSDVFQYIHRYIKSGEWTLYFEETQWLANYQDTFIAELKHAWDNYFRHNKQLLIILCGSAPAFMINHVAHSKALYNRSQHELSLAPFTLSETRQFLQQYSAQAAMEAYLTVGGIPTYLERLTDKSSVLLSLCDNAFTKDAFFAHEYQRIFISSLADDKKYQDIIRFLSHRRFATRDDILKHLKVQSGKNITALLDDLLLCGFIEKYRPYHAKANSILIRYRIADAYAHFYFAFIEPKQDQITRGQYDDNPRAALSDHAYRQWLGYAFERFCRQQHHVLAKVLGFSGIDYRAGAYFNRGTIKADPGYQLDLVFDRADHVITVCEIKYSKNPVSSRVIAEFERKLALFDCPKNKSIQKVLIVGGGGGVAGSVVDEGYFDQIVSGDELGG